MSETPEETAEWFEVGGSPDREPTLEQRFAALLTTNRNLEAAIAHQEDYMETIASLRTQLQQAEQERDQAELNLKAKRAALTVATLQGQEERIRAERAESQLQQAETALRAAHAINSQWQEDYDYLQKQLADASETRLLAAPPPNTKDDK